MINQAIEEATRLSKKRIAWSSKPNISFPRWYRRKPNTCSINVDPKPLRQLIANRLHNAVKFTPSDGRIDLPRDADNEVILTTQSSGIGI